MTKEINAACGICGNVSSYDKQSLKGSTWKANGCKIVLCCPCEDDLLEQMLARKGLTRRRILDIASLLMSEEAQDLLSLIPERED